jgi:hypothetical protein
MNAIECSRAALWAAPLLHFVRDQLTNAKQGRAFSHARHNRVFETETPQMTKKGRNPAIPPFRFEPL